MAKGKKGYSKKSGGSSPKKVKGGYGGKRDPSLPKGTVKNVSGGDKIQVKRDKGYKK